MGEIFNGFLSALFFVTVLRSILFWVYLWQLKEYRFDRLYTHFKETEAGRSIFLSPLEVFKSLFTLLIIFATLYSFENIIITCVVFLLFARSTLYFIYEGIAGTLKKPKLNLKASLICFLSFGLILLFFFIPFINFFYWLYILDRLVSLVVAVFVAFMWFPSEFYTNAKIYFATIKRSRLSKLSVIGITGSYGKSSTKEYITDILSSFLNVVSTPRSVNTATGIASIIIAKVNSSTDVLVLEMGAYKKDEILELCEAFKPSIGILTGINDQHMSLFGSLDVIKKTKYELIENLNYNGLALFNGNNKYVYNLYKKTKRKKKILYYSSFEGDLKKDATITARKISFSKFSTSFTVYFDSKEPFKVKIKNLGRPSVENILPAIYLAFYFKIKQKVLLESLHNIKPFSGRMQPLYHIKTGAVLINDTYNANPDSILSAIEYSKLYKGKKIMVLSPLIELGKDSSNIHKSLGNIIGGLFDYVYVTNKNFFADLQEGIENTDSACILKHVSSRQIGREIEEMVRKQDIVLFLGREAGAILAHFIYEEIN